MCKGVSYFSEVRQFGSEVSLSLAGFFGRVFACYSDPPPKYMADPGTVYCQHWTPSEASRVCGELYCLCVMARFEKSGQPSPSGWGVGVVMAYTAFVFNAFFTE